MASIDLQKMQTKTISLVVERHPIPWKAPQLSRKGAFSPTSKEKQIGRSIVKRQWTKGPIKDPVFIRFTFYMPIPKSLKNRVKEGDWHVKRPDLTNLQKLAEDYLIGSVIFDDNQTCRLESKKMYSYNPRTEIELEVCV